MTRISALIFSILLALSELSGTAGTAKPQKPEPPVVATAGIVAADASPDELARLDASVALFRDAGLDLPALDVRFSEDDADCSGSYGLFQPRFQPWRVTICSDLPFVLPHELAHAWEASSLSDNQRSRYQVDRGFTNWNDHDVPWGERATEDAAFIIQQNLTAANASMSSRTWRERAEAYELLTSRVSPLRSEPISASV